jgi:hypothetical protein
MQLKRIGYGDLNARQKENFNFQKVSAVLADYGFVTLLLTDDWQGADFIAQHIDGSTFLRVQLKGRFAFDAKYRGKDLWIAFGDGDTWYLYPHDEVLTQVIGRIGTTVSWEQRGGYSYSQLSKRHRELLERYRISGDTKAIPE